MEPVEALSAQSALLSCVSLAQPLISMATTAFAVWANPVERKVRMCSTQCELYSVFP
mgnify:CR=1 FL=1